MTTVNPESLKEAKNIMAEIHAENTSYWPYGLRVDAFNGGCYLVREKRSNVAAGFVGWQQRQEMEGSAPVTVGYYSIGILPKYRRSGFAKEAVAKIIRIKAASVDRVKALVMSNNRPSLNLASALSIPVKMKKA